MLKTLTSDFMAVLYGEPIRDITKRKFKVGYLVRYSEQGLFFRNGYKVQFTKEIFLIVALATRKPPYYIHDEQGEVNKGKFFNNQ